MFPHNFSVIFSLQRELPRGMRTAYICTNLIQLAIYLLNCNRNEEVFNIFVGNKKNYR